jgi:hypothetical protein
MIQVCKTAILAFAFLFHSSSLLASVRDFQIGPEWGKRELTSSLLLQMPKALQSDALATSAFNGGTGVLIKLKARIFLVTNVHVVIDLTDNCKNPDGHSAVADFQLLNVVLKCKRIISRTEQFDFAVLEIIVPQHLESLIDRTAISLDRAQDATPGEPLITFGHGSPEAGVGEVNLSAGFDLDCMSFAPSHKARLLKDPDTNNTVPYLVWSTPIGCDAAPGDSGSGVFSRKTGALVGFIWTGRFPKSAKVRNRTYLQSLLKTEDKAIWKDLNYMIPISKIKTLF